jgi:hypothetical protein
MSLLESVAVSPCDPLEQAERKAVALAAIAAVKSELLFKSKPSKSNVSEGRRKQRERKYANLGLDRVHALAAPEPLSWRHLRTQKVCATNGTITYENT